MNDVFKDYLDEFICVYLDDILVYSNSLNDYFRHLRLVLDNLRSYMLYANLNKCQSSQEAANYLGHNISAAGLSMEDAKIRAIQTMSIPPRKTDVQSYLVLVHFFRRLIENMAEVATPLMRLTGNVEFEWTSSASAAFQHLKTLVSSPPVLRGFDEQHRTYV